MSLCRFYPLPSDRMAIMWSLMPIEGAIVLEYGPAGTTHFGGGFYSSFGISLDHTLFTTHISEDDVIMGDVTRLENAILELDRNYSPKVIFVVASAVIAVIGTDITGVCKYMQEKVNAKLVAFSDGGFRGDYTYGLRAVYNLFSEQLIDKSLTAKEENTYQILGASAGSYRVRSDVWEIQQLMREAFGMKCRMVMGLECGVEDIVSAGASELNIVLRCEALEVAGMLKESFGTEYVYGAPYGYKGTLDWLEKISAVTGIPINPALVARLREKIMYMRPMGGPMGRIRKKPPTASVQGDYDTIIGISAALEEMELDIDLKLCSHSMKAIESPAEDIKHYADEKQRIELFKQQHDRWILGSMEAAKCCPEDNYFTCISSPFEGRSQIANHLPFMGEKGMDYLMECKDDYFSKCGI